MKLSRLLPALAVAPYAALCLSHASAVPMWDARIYTDCIESAVRIGTFPAAYNCAGHPTATWAFLVSRLLFLAPDSFWPLLLVNVALGVLGLLAFLDLLRALFPDGEHEALLLTACLGVFPVVAAGTVDLNPDHGVLVFFLLVLRALIRARPVEAALFGLLLAFSKEPGVLLYGLAAVLWTLVFVTRRSGTPREKLDRIARAWPLALPLLAFGAFVWKGSRGGANPLWHAPGGIPLLETFTSFKLMDPPFLAQLIGIFVLQFAWVVSLFALLRWVRMAVRAAFALGPAEPPPLFFFDALLVAATLLLTRYQTFLNLRYYLAVTPLLLVCGLSGLRELLPRPARLAVLAALAGLFFGSALRTLDPVSRAALGTVAFGRHEVLDMTSLTGECCGHGRDQYGYNLQHLQLNALINTAMDHQQGHHFDRALTAAALADHHTVGRLDVHTWHRTLGQDSVLPRVWTADDLAGGPRPRALLYLRFFYLDNALEEARLRHWYDATSETTYDVDGYTLTAVDYRLRPDDAATR